MTKTSIYFMPGLGTGPAIFEKLKLSSKKYSCNYLTWKKPNHPKETISDYAKRMAKEVTEKQAVLVGVSFGGILVQEMSKFLDVKKIIIISSIKSNKELPLTFKFLKVTKLYKLFPTKIFSDFENYNQLLIGKLLKKKAANYTKYFTERDKSYLNWAIRNVLHWQQTSPQKNTVHLHGTADGVFPMKNIQNAIKINDGIHSMILTKAKEVAKLIDKTLTF